MPKLTLAEIAGRIDAHLKRFEADLKINRPVHYTPTCRVPDYRRCGAIEFGIGLRIQYRPDQRELITHEDAERYLAWLDAGNVGRHWEALREEI